MQQQVPAAQKRGKEGGSEDERGVKQQRWAIPQQQRMQHVPPHTQEHRRPPQTLLLPGPPPMPPDVMQLADAVGVVRSIRETLQQTGGDVEALVRSRARTPQEAGALREVAEAVRRTQQDIGFGRQPP